MSRSEDAVISRRALFELGHELPGPRLRALAAQLLVAARDSPDASVDDLVADAMAAIQDGPTALVAEEPELRSARLDPLATTVTVTALAHSLIAAYRSSSF